MLKAAAFAVKFGQQTQACGAAAHSIDLFVMGKLKHHYPFNFTIITTGLSVSRILFSF
jgi:hypothetical protein